MQLCLTHCSGPSRVSLSLLTCLTFGPNTVATDASPHSSSEAMYNHSGSHPRPTFRARSQESLQESSQIFLSQRKCGPNVHRVWLLNLYRGRGQDKENRKYERITWQEADSDQWGRYDRKQCVDKILSWLSQAAAVPCGLSEDLLSMYPSYWLFSCKLHNNPTLYFLSLLICFSPSSSA